MAELPNTSLPKGDQLTTSIGTQEVQAMRVESLREKVGTPLGESQEVEAVRAEQFERKAGKGKESK